MPEAIRPASELRELLIEFPGWEATLRKADAYSWAFLAELSVMPDELEDCWLHGEEAAAFEGVMGWPEDAEGLTAASGEAAVEPPWDTA